MRALMNGSDENVRSERFKLFFFPLVAKDKKMHLGSQPKFLVSVPTFWGRPLPLLKVCHFGKKRNEREREKEDMRREL